MEDEKPWTPLSTLTKSGKRKLGRLQWTGTLTRAKHLKIRTVSKVKDELD